MSGELTDQTVKNVIRFTGRDGLKTAPWTEGGGRD